MILTGYYLAIFSLFSSFFFNKISYLDATLTTHIISALILGKKREEMLQIEAPFEK